LLIEAVAVFREVGLPRYIALGLAAYARALAADGARDLAFAACSEGLRLSADTPDYLSGADLLRALADLWADHDGSVAVELLAFAARCDERAGVVASPAATSDVDSIAARAHLHLGGTGDEVRLGSVASCEEALKAALALPPPPQSQKVDS
jgi:hypothetical protein